MTHSHSLRACRGANAFGVVARVWVMLALLWGLVGRGEAQLARNAINVTAIRVSKLPNATQIRIETDGTAQFGGDLADFIDFSTGFSPKSTQTLRLRLPNARSRVPAFVPLDAYPVDGASVSQGRDTFANPYFGGGSNGSDELNVQVELRFAAPIRVTRFDPDPYGGINFDEVLGPLGAQVELSNDRRAIVVTIITDRSDALATQRLNRSPRAARHSTLILGGHKNGRFRLEALHTSLKNVLDGVGQLTKRAFLARPEVADLDVSLVLPDTDVEELLLTLRAGYGLGLRDENGATVLGRGDEFFETRTLPLRNLQPDAARLLFPDFLLPFLRADRASNTLLVSQTAPLADKIALDLARLDAPRAQFDIGVEAWEISDTRAVDQTLSLARSIGADSQTFDFGAGTAGVRVETGQTNRLSFALNFLSQRGRARLVANPHVTALSGERGSLFLGQTRYVQVIRNSFGGQSAQALALQIGTTLGVTPRGDGLSGAILLDVAPRVSTVDEIEAGTGLPTLGIREASATVRIEDGETLILAGLDFALDAKAKRRTLKIVPSKRETGDARALLVLVTAKRVGSGGETEVAGTQKVAPDAGKVAPDAGKAGVE